MSETRYDAHPSMIRMRPFATPMTLLLMLGGILLALAAPALLTRLPLPLAAQIEPRTAQIAGILIFGLAALQLLVWWVRTRADRLIVTDDELIWSHGLLNKQYTEIGMSSVRTVQVSQSLLQRLLNAGDIRVFTAGDLPELTIRGLPDPGRIRVLVKGAP